MTYEYSEVRGGTLKEKATFDLCEDEGEETWQCLILFIIATIIEYYDYRYNKLSLNISLPYGTNES